ncbi:hypothetical protein VTK73DRAFT_5483 [Phialemonium thermophilum]|uniref:Uncharacterized protein n=1 Tax=Phialemonium thermophilum TaxID=223376 RepID=A0ABR3V2C9_9PEZI
MPILRPKAVQTAASEPCFPWCPHGTSRGPTAIPRPSLSCSPGLASRSMYCACTPIPSPPPSPTVRSCCAPSRRPSTPPTSTPCRAPTASSPPSPT